MRCAFVICLFSLCLIPDLVGATSYQSGYEDLPTKAGYRDSLPHALCAALAATGVVAGYDEQSFVLDSTNGWRRGPYLDFVVAFINQTADVEPNRYVLPNLTLREVRRELLEGFGTYLTVTAVRPDPEPQSGYEWHSKPFGIALLKLDLLMYPQGLAGMPQVADPPQLGISADNGHSAYDDVPGSDPAYEMLDKLSRTPLLEGYPVGFFNGNRTLTRYEFAQAIVRVLDMLEAQDYPLSEVAADLRKEGLSSRELMRLVIAFVDQLADMQGHILYCL